MKFKTSYFYNVDWVNVNLRPYWSILFVLPSGLIVRINLIMIE